MNLASPRVLIVGYGMGNIGSVRRAFEECGASVTTGCDSESFRGASHVVLPGVGSFHEGMERLVARDVPSMLERFVIQEGRALLGICLGMQLLAREGVEGGATRGLGLIDGEVLPLRPADSRERIPHVGWNEVHHDASSPLLASIPSGMDFYFVHSFAISCRRPEQVVAQTPYCGSFASVVGDRNVWGTQFHPEKSQRAGMQLIRNFLSL